MIVTTRLDTLRAVAGGALRPGPATLDGHPVRLLALPTTLPGSPLRWRFECPICYRPCTLLRRPEAAAAGLGSDTSPGPWRCRLCLPVPRARRLTRRKERLRRAEETLATLRQTPPERQRYEHWKTYRNRMEAERAAMAALTAAASALAASFRRGKGR